jgi:hypothetical protein
VRCAVSFLCICGSGLWVGFCFWFTYNATLQTCHARALFLRTLHTSHLKKMHKNLVCVVQLNLSLSMLRNAQGCLHPRIAPITASTTYFCHTNRGRFCMDTHPSFQGAPVARLFLAPIDSMPKCHHKRCSACCFCKSEVVEVWGRGGGPTFFELFFIGSRRAPGTWAWV